MGGAGRVIGIFLDGYEPSLEATMRAAGELPELDALAARGARVRLEHGPAQRTGLAGEHLSTGRTPDAVGRHAAVDFDPESYVARQVGTRFPTFVELIDAPTVVFDVPYFDLARTTGARGVVNWGAHDPGVPTSGRPDTLLDELLGRFGPYPAPEFLYGTPWASAEHCQRMGQSLTRAVDTRTDASLWLLRERLHDWRFALVAVSEPHSGIEGLWHGIDPDHPLAGMPSAGVAGDGVRSIYRAVDRLVGAHVRAFPDATVVVFSMHGMGTNVSDVASMVLLPELLHRWGTGDARLQPPAAWTRTPSVPPPLEPGASWSETVRRTGAAGDRASLPRRAVRKARRTFGRRTATGTDPSLMPWMPATWYADAWPKLSAFALPSFYDGRVRVNLAGRERCGLVPLDRYDGVLDEIEELIRSCVDPATGSTAVASVERIAADRDVDPRTLGRSDADLVVVWKGPLALRHPDLGLIGPFPFRRTGGHSAPYGSAVIAGSDVPPGDLAPASAFDVVPTFFSLLGEAVPDGISGRPLLADSPTHHG